MGPRVVLAWEILLYAASLTRLRQEEVTAVVGVVLLAAGLVGLLVGQPYVVYYPFLLLGLIMSAVFGGLYPVMRTRYRQAETRKLEAEALRRA